MDMEMEMMLACNEQSNIIDQRQFERGICPHCGVRGYICKKKD